MNKLKEKELIILQQRAEKIALPEKKDDNRTFVNVVNFRLAGEIYALNCHYIKEIIKIKEITSIPNTPDFVSGVINLRGKIVSVISLTSYLKLSETGFADIKKIIILGNDKFEFGILIEDILGADIIFENDLQKVPTNLKGEIEKYIIGITLDNKILINGQKLLDDDKLIINLKK